MSIFSISACPLRVDYLHVMYVCMYVCMYEYSNVQLNKCESVFSISEVISAFILYFRIMAVCFCVSLSLLCIIGTSLHVHLPVLFHYR